MNKMDNPQIRHELPVQEEKAQLQKRDRQRTYLFGWATAASVIFISTLCIYFWQYRRPASALSQAQRFGNDLRPGTTGATIEQPDSTGQNHVTTAKGQTWSLVLPDSTKVWLNAASSLKYPTVFTDSQRQVELTGEAYFEVHPDPKRLFIVLLPDEAKVKTNKGKFDIYAYTDESSFLTSLVTDSAEMDAGSIYRSPLKPGQAAGYWRLKELAPGSAIDLNWVLAWKNGLFILNYEMTVMKDIERWYNAEIIYETGAQNDTTRFHGTVPRTAPVSELLKQMESQSRLRFTIHGNTITVSKLDSVSHK